MTSLFSEKYPFDKIKRDTWLAPLNTAQHAPQPKAPLIILDRDGVINQDSDQYIKKPAEWQAIPGSLAAIAQLNQAGIRVAVATNQSGLARGFFDATTLDAIHAKMHQQLQAVGGHIDYLVYCPHGPAEHCACRKPQPGLYQQIADYFSCNLQDIPVIGDNGRDLAAAEQVGAWPIRVLTGTGEQTAKDPRWAKTLSFENLQQTVNYLLEPFT